MIETICKQCNKKFSSYPSLNRIFCSTKCQHLGQLGKTPSLGYKHTQQAKDSIAKAHKGSKNLNWKGDNASYRSFHTWVNTQKGKPQICVDCGVTCKERKIAWSNIDHKYRRNLDDYQSRCYPCHAIYDKSL